MTKRDAELWLEYRYPVVITRDRYGGRKPGCPWTAFAEHDVPAGSRESNVTVDLFWAEWREPVGFGETPMAALESLVAAVRKVAKGES